MGLPRWTRLIYDKASTIRPGYPALLILPKNMRRYRMVWETRLLNPDPTLWSLLSLQVGLVHKNKQPEIRNLRFLTRNGELIWSS